MFFFPIHLKKKILEANNLHYLNGPYLKDSIMDLIAKDRCNR